MPHLMAISSREKQRDIRSARAGSELYYVNFRSFFGVPTCGTCRSLARQKTDGGRLYQAKSNPNCKGHEEESHQEVEVSEKLEADREGQTLTKRVDSGIVCVKSVLKYAILLTVCVTPVVSFGDAGDSVRTTVNQSRKFP